MWSLVAVLQRDVDAPVVHPHRGQVHLQRAQYIYYILQCEAIKSEQFENEPFHKPTTYKQHV